jgi:hypothetical protein
MHRLARVVGHWVGTAGQANTHLEEHLKQGRGYTAHLGGYADHKRDTGRQLDFGLNSIAVGQLNRMKK